MKSKILKFLAIGMFAGLLSSNQASAATTVGLELALLVDVSGSVDTTEFQIQRNGYVAAFQSPTIHALIATLASQNGGNGLAVSYTQWSEGQQLSVGWTLINTAAESNAFAAAILAAARPSTGGGFGTGTDLGDAVVFGTNQLNGNMFDGRQVIDVSGDGESNGGVTAASARTFALANNVDRINGLPIGSASLTAYYTSDVVGGLNAFVLPANSFDDFAPAIERKLAAEITNTGVPEGGPGLAMTGLLLLGFAGVHRKMVLRSKSC